MIGTYRFKQQGELLVASKNVITTDGRRQILRFLASEIEEWAGSIAVGVYHQAATAGDKRLAFEADRAPIELRVADLKQDSIVFRATFAQGVIGRIYEVGVVSSDSVAVGLGGSQMLTRFDTTQEEIEGGVVDVNNYRLSDRTLSLVLNAAQTKTIVLPSYYKDFSVYSDGDTFALAYQLFDANTANITVRFVQDGSNYFEHSFAPAAAAGYYVSEWLLGACIAVGNPSWDSITRLEFHATAGAAAVVNFDGFRLHDTEASNDYALVSRSVLSAPLTKNPDQELEIEYEVTMDW